MPNIIKFMRRSKCPESYQKFLASYFFNLRNICLDFFQTVTSETILMKKTTV